MMWGLSQCSSLSPPSPFNQMTGRNVDTTFILSMNIPRWLSLHIVMDSKMLDNISMMA
jgi:hypothetical protein